MQCGRVELVRQPQQISGHIYGLAQHSVRVNLRLHHPSSPIPATTSLASPAEMGTVRILNRDGQPLRLSAFEATGSGILISLCNWLWAIFSEAELPVCPDVVVEEFSASTDSESVFDYHSDVCLVIPTLSTQLLSNCIKQLIDVFNTAQGADSRLNQPLIDLFQNELARQIDTHGFTRVAYKSDIPVINLSDTTFQLGWGAKSFWVDRSMSHAHPALLVGLSKSRTRSAALLAEFGVPVPPTVAAETIDVAEKTAENIGYPLMILDDNPFSKSDIEFLVFSPNQLRRKFSRLNQSRTTVTLQSYPKGVAYTVIWAFGTVVSFVRANLSGSQEANWSGVHPDNRDLLSRVVALLNASVLQIDFVSTDITCSWKQIGGWVTGIDPAPLIDPNRHSLAETILNNQIGDSGRIPVAGLSKDLRFDLWTDSLIKVCAQHNMTLGLVMSDGVFLGHHWFMDSGSSSTAAVRALMLDHPSMQF